MFVFCGFVGPPAVDVLTSMRDCSCLQLEGEKKAEAVATVVAAVDLARVRQPPHEEEGIAEEEEAVEVEIRGTPVVSEPSPVQISQVQTSPLTL